MKNVFWRYGLFLLALSAFCLPASASDLTLFGGIQRQGQLTVRSSPGVATDFFQTFDPKNFGVFGARISGGKVIGNESTIAYARNFIQSGNHAFIYHSNLLIQAPTPVLKPYGTVGLGLIHSGGDAPTSFGSKLAINYGGGAKLMSGPLGVNLDVRGYTIPRFAIEGYEVQRRLTFVQVTVGVVFGF